MARSSRKMVVSVIVLLVLLVVAIVYIVYGIYMNQKLQEQQNILMQGAQLGYEQAISQLFQSAGACQQVPLTYNNQTINIIAVECLQQAQAQAAA